MTTEERRKVLTAGMVARIKRAQVEAGTRCKPNAHDAERDRKREQEARRLRGEAS